MDEASSPERAKALPPRNDGGHVTLILTNDDGIDAPGIDALRKAVKGQCIVVAPREHLSGCSHTVSTWKKPIHVHRRADDAYAIDGTPADCARVAITHLHPETTCVISGINLGGNMGADVYISGTVAAAREAAFLGVTGIAVSQYVRRGLDLDWGRAIRWTTAILEDLIARPFESGTYWNVNLPHLEPGAPDPETVFCQLCTNPLPVSYRVEGEHLHYDGVYSDRRPSPNSDVEHCFGGHIAVTQLRL